MLILSQERSIVIITVSIIAAAFSTRKPPKASGIPGPPWFFGAMTAAPAAPIVEGCPAFSLEETKGGYSKWGHSESVRVVNFEQIESATR